jgi:hypothetical protein
MVPKLLLPVLASGLLLAAAAPFAPARPANPALVVDDSGDAAVCTGWLARR